MRFADKQRVVVQVVSQPVGAQTATPTPPKPKSTLEVVKDIFAIAAPYVMPLLMFFMGYVFSESIKLENDRRRLSVELPAKRFEIFKESSAESQERDAANSRMADLRMSYRALALADMGDEGVHTLLFMSHKEQSEPIDRALRHAATVRPAETCAIFRKVLGSRGGAYHISVHNRVMEHIERVGCDDMGATVRDYLDDIEGWFANGCVKNNRGQGCGKVKLLLSGLEDDRLCDVRKSLQRVSARTGVALAAPGPKSLLSCGT